MLTHERRPHMEETRMTTLVRSLLGACALTTLSLSAYAETTLKTLGVSSIEVLVKQPGMVAVQQKMLVGWSLWQALHKTHRAFAKPASWFPACQRGRSCAGRVEQVSPAILPQ